MKRTIRYLLNEILANKKYFFVLTFIIALFTFTIFSGNIVNYSIKKGINNTQKRLGADLMLVPKNSKDVAEGILLTGQRGNFYFDKSIYNKISKMEKIKDVTAQCYLKSLSADCCSSEVEIVFYDPNTDFIVEPWIEKKYDKELEKNKVIVGNAIECEDNKIKLFSKEYDVVAKMSKTGTSLDTSVYFTMESMPDIIKTAQEKKSFLSKEQEKGNIVSSIFVNLKDENDTSEFVKKASQLVGDEFDVVYPKQLNESLSKNLGFITNINNIIMITIGIILLIIFFITNHLSMGQRKQEVALLRILGNSKSVIVRLLLGELTITSFLASLIGIFFSILIIIPFGDYIGEVLEMAYLGPSLLEIIVRAIFIMIAMNVIVIISSLFSVLYICNMQPYLALKKEAE